MINKKASLTPVLIPLITVGILVLGIFGFFDQDQKEISINLTEKQEKEIKEYKKFDPSPPNSEINFRDVIVRDDEVKIQNLQRFCTFKDKLDLGNSMHPVISTKTTYLVNKCFKTRDLEIGDIIIFKDKYNFFEGSSVVHRVTYIGEDQEGMFFLTTGDNNKRDDDVLLRQEDLVGRVFGLIY